MVPRALGGSKLRVEADKGKTMCLPGITRKTATLSPAKQPPCQDFLVSAECSAPPPRDLSGSLLKAFGPQHCEAQVFAWQPSQ